LVLPIHTTPSLQILRWRFTFGYCITRCFRTDLLPPWSRVVIEKLPVLSYSMNSPHILEKGFSFPRLQDFSNCPFCKPHESSPAPIHFNIVLASTSRYSTWTPAIRSPHQNHSCTSSASLLATYPTHNIPIYLINRITCDEEHISLTSCVVFPTHL